jgi:uncharacterized protein with ParB-like and HNH nuclease domain
MQIVPSSETVAQFCEGLRRNQIKVDRRYQRSEKVWPANAQSFLIESILLGFPVPKLFLHQSTDRVSRKTVHHIIDGQQRSVAIRSFADDEIRLAKNLELKEAAGRTYSELPPELQDRFLSYSLGIDRFVNTSEEQVRDIFRRINSYEVPLNAEEQRHARYQGEFKWFIYHLSRALDTYFDEYGTFSDSQLVRMQDMKLLAEISHALLNGISTTSKTTLDALYRDNNETFAGKEEFSDKIEQAVIFVDSLSAVHDTGLMKPYSMYALVLAIIHADTAVPTLKEHASGGKGLAKPKLCEQRLSVLAAAIDEGEAPRKLQTFVKASEKGTNVKAARGTRFKFCLDAVSKQGGKLIPEA